MKIAQQANSVEVAARLISGAAPKPSAREQAYILEGLRAASVTMRWLEANEDKIRAKAAA